MLVVFFFFYNNYYIVSSVSSFALRSLPSIHLHLSYRVNSSAIIHPHSRVVILYFVRLTAIKKTWTSSIDRSSSCCKKKPLRREQRMAIRELVFAREENHWRGVCFFSGKKNQEKWEVLSQVGRYSIRVSRVGGGEIWDFRTAMAKTRFQRR